LETENEHWGNVTARMSTRCCKTIICAKQIKGECDAFKSLEVREIELRHRVNRRYSGDL
jgi:hypothetical protein